MALLKVGAQGELVGLPFPTYCCRAADKVNGKGWCTSELAVDATRYSRGSQSVPSRLMHESMGALMR
jgi:hypothetical protein